MQAAIGIDYTPAYEQGGGIGRYVRELVAALVQAERGPTYKLFVAGANAPPDALGLLGVSWHTTRLSNRWLARIWHRARIPYRVERWLGDVDLFHATDFTLPPLRPTTRSLLTVHDLSYIFAPETASPRLRAYLERVVPRSVARADHVLADSQATKADLIRVYGVPESKVTALLSGVNAAFRPVQDPAARARYGLGAWPFLLSVGTIQPRKNYARLCEALARLRPRFPDVRLVIAGGRGWLEGPIFQTVQRLGLSDRVHFTGFVDDADLPALYSMAEALVFVPLYEGFGLPVLEAMACHTPVITSSVSSLPEVAGDAALLVDPKDIDAIADAITRLLTSPGLRQDLVQRGAAQAARFTWSATAQHLLTLYEKVLAP